MNKASDGSRYGIYRFLLIPLLFLLLADSPLESGPATYTNRANIAYRPILNREGYVQAWNINFLNKEYSVFCTFLISNMGPGSLNNGYTILYRRKGKNTVLTSEFSRRSLKAKIGRLDMILGYKNILRRNSKGHFYVKIDNKKFFMELKLKPYGRGISMTGGPMSTSKTKKTFIRSDIPVVSAHAEGFLIIKGKKIPLRGVGGVEHLRSNSSPHSFAKRFTVTRTFTARQSLLMGSLNGTKNFPGKSYGRVVYMKGGRILKNARIIKSKVIKSQRNSFSGYRIPIKTEHSLEGPGLCKLTEVRRSSLGGYYVLGNISAVLRWVLRVLYAKPYILHYRNRLTLSCKGDEGTEKKMWGMTSHYLIND